MTGLNNLVELKFIEKILKRVYNSKIVEFVDQTNY